MKTILKYVSAILVICLTGALVLSLVFSCSSTPDGTTTGGGRDGGSSDGGGYTDDDDLTCALPECGGECCSPDDKDCKKWCTGSSYFGLSGGTKEGTPAAKCYALSKEFIEDTLLFLFYDILGDDLDAENLVDKINLSDDASEGGNDINSMCAAIRELDSDILNEVVEDMNSGEARTFLHWVSYQANPSAIALFDRTSKQKDGVEIFKELLEKSGTGTEYKGILDGLNKKESEEAYDDDDESKNVFRRALDQDHDDFIYFVHKKVIKDDDLGICGDDQKSKTHPEPVCGSASNNYSTGDPCNRAKENSGIACAFAVYCHITGFDSAGTASPQTPDNDLRKDLAELPLDRNINNFIKDEVDDGGLGLKDEEDDYQEWSKDACQALKNFWKNRGNTGIFPGLGAS